MQENDSNESDEVVVNGFDYITEYCRYGCLHIYDMDCSSRLTGELDQKIVNSGYIRMQVTDCLVVVPGVTVTVVALHAGLFDAEALPPPDDAAFPTIEQV